jgi:hypothetical protein
MTLINLMKAEKIFNLIFQIKQLKSQVIISNLRYQRSI